MTSQEYKDCALSLEHLFERKDIQKELVDIFTYHNSARESNYIHFSILSNQEDSEILQQAGCWIATEKYCVRIENFDGDTETNVDPEYFDEKKVRPKVMQMIGSYYISDRNYYIHMECILRYSEPTVIEGIKICKLITKDLK